MTLTRCLAMPFLLSMIVCHSVHGQSVDQLLPSDSDRNTRSEFRLNIYGPGGPFLAIRECANVFGAKNGINVQVKSGTPLQWIDEARKNGDLMFQGAEFMLTEFMRAYPGLIDESSITGLYARAVAILVREGNPHNIRSAIDLGKPGLKVMVVTQERMEEVYRGVPGVNYNLAFSVLTGKQAENIWKTNPKPDAWITYETWFHAMDKGGVELIELTGGERILRMTPIALFKSSRNKKAANEFVDFLRTEEAHKIFQKWGWK